MKTTALALTALLVTVTIVVGGLILWDGPTAAEADLSNTMSVDAVSGGAIDASRTVTDSAPFDVDIHIQHGGSPSLDYSGYDIFLCFDSTLVDFVPTEDLDGDTTVESWAYTDLGGLLVHVAVYEASSGGCPTGFPDTSLYGGSVRPAGRTDVSGVHATARFRCVGSGTTTLRLVPDDDKGPFSSTSGALGGHRLPTALSDATITCSLPPTPTPCPPEVCTPTPTATPTLTPTSTPTPDPDAPPNVMSVDAVSGGDIDAERRLPVGSEFDVDIHIQHGGSAGVDYAGYNAYLCFDPTVLDFLPTEDLTGDTTPESWTYTGLGDMFLWAVTAEYALSCPEMPSQTLLHGGAARAAGLTNVSGAAVQAHFACVGQGTSTTHLIGEEDDPVRFTSTLGPGGVHLPTDLVDATVTCLPDVDGDRCSDIDELAMDFRPINPWDFFTVPVPANPDGSPNGPRDAAVDITDVLAVLSYAGTYEGDGGTPNPNGVAYDSVKGSCPVPFIEGAVQEEGLCYDRSPGTGANPPYDAGPPDGAISIIDVLVAVSQAGLDCSGDP